MAEGLYDGPLTKNMDFTNPVQDGRPASGLAVQNYIKEIDSNKMGVGYTEDGGAKHLFFADEADRDEYIADPSKTYLIKDTIELEPMYYMNVNPISELYNTVFLGDKGNFIEYTFQTTNRNGFVVAESVTVTYTIAHAGSSQVVTQIYAPGTTVRFNVDNYILEGTNNISIEIKGQLTKVSTSFSVVYQVVDLVLTDNMNISTVYRINDGDINLQVPYSVSGVGQKTMEWYIDGERVPINPQEDIISDATSSRTKYINIVGLTQGAHSLQFRVGINVNGTTYYSSVRYREFIISLGQAGDPIVVTATDFPSDVAVLGPSDPLVITLTQYETFPLRVAVFNPSGQYQNDVIASVNNVTLANIVCVTGEESQVSLTLTQEGSGTLVLTTGSYSREIDIDVEETELDIHEIDGGLVMNFTAEGKSNESQDKNTWTDRGGVYSANLYGFDWTNVSGWVDNRLIIPSGAHIDFNITPLFPSPTSEGKTIEIEFKTINVEDENATLINLINSGTGAGVKLTATEIQVKSKDGNVDMNRRYKTDEDVRLSIVINRSSGSLLSRLAQVYFNGILSMTQEFTDTDNFTCPKYLKVGGEGAGIILKQIRIYDTALDADSVVNNYILYRPTVEDMLEVYERNDLYETGLTSFDLDKIAAYLPVMILTGDMEPINTATDNKATTVMDVEYTNLQNPTYSFRAVNTQMRPQGTSSLTYPRKNLRLYLNKRDDTELYDYEGKPVSRVGGKLLYSFKPKAQPVDCWTLKADFAESSSTHNTGVARIWNEVMKQTQVDGNYVLRTEAQECARLNGYQYDVRTTVDGFPIVIFWHRYASDPLTFLGKYNFNNDKSTESVFGFKDIPGFDNSHVNCWEFRDSGYNLALFKTPSNGRTYAEEFDYYASHTTVDNNWMFNQVWESRYPDYNKPDADVSQLRRLALWINSTEGAAVIDDDPSHSTYGQLIVGNQSKFEEWQTHKTDYFDLPKLAAYYIYLMRFGGVDQTVKNAMMTTEDGEHWYFINYDNDTILGVRNDGILAYGPEINRQSKDAGGSWVYAGHESVLWNNFEVDPECMSMVRTIDSALVGGGLTYANMIKMFNEEQAGKWAEKVYNKDAMYKYIEPWLYEDEKYLESLQGSRSDHRKWWISNRFANYDALYANSSYTNTAIHFLIPDAPPTSTFTIEAGRDFYYGWGQNRTPVDIGVHVGNGQTHTFQLEGGMDEWQVGTPLYIYAPSYIKTLNISNLLPYLYTNFDINDAWSDTLGSKLKSLIIGVDDPSDPRRGRNEFNDISGLPKIVTLENLNIAGCVGMRSIDLSTLVNLKTFKAQASGLTSVIFANGAPLNHVEFPLSLAALTLNSLPALRTDGMVFEEDATDRKVMKNITNISIHGCPNITNSPDLILDWLDDKTADDDLCTVDLDNVYWELISHEDLTKICEFKRNGGHLNLVGMATLETIGSEAFATYLRNTFIDEFDVFNPTSQFYIQAPPDIFISGRREILEGESEQYTAVIIGGAVGGTLSFAQTSGYRTGINLTSDGLLTTTEDLSADFTIGISVMYAVPGSSPIFKDATIVIKKRVYPSSDQVTLTGPEVLQIGVPAQYDIDFTVPGITGDMTANWSLTGDLSTDAQITYSDNEKCIIVIPTKPASGLSFGNISVTLVKTVSGTTVATKTAPAYYQDDDIAISRASNPYLMDVMVNNNLINPIYGDTNDKMTKTSAGTILASQLYTDPSSQTSSTSIFAKDSNFRNRVTSFNEFQYFTRVGEVGDYLFQSCSALKSIILPQSVTSIGYYAFNDCSNLETVTLPSSLVTIKQRAFYNCAKISITPQLPSSLVTIGDYAFYQCRALTGVLNIPASLTTIGSDAFERCTGLTSISFAESSPSLTTINNNAFNGCTGLTGILNLPSSLTTLGGYAFGGCTGLTSVITNSNITFNNCPFSNCTGLTHVTFNGNVPNSALNVNTSYTPFYGCTNINSVTIGPGCTGIGSQAFYNCTWITGDFVIPEGITKIEYRAFYGCSGITSFTFPTTLNQSDTTAIGDEVCARCTGVTSITYKCTNVGQRHGNYSGLIGGCINVETITFTEDVRTLGTSNGALIFDGRNNQLSHLTTVNIPSSITTFGSNIFQQCSALTTVNFNLTSVPDYCFDANTGSSAKFNNCTNITTINLNEECTSIGHRAFGYLPNLTSLDIPDTVTTIGTHAFYNCTSLESVTLPAGLTTIGTYTFYGCSSLESVDVPTGVTSIGQQAFYNCTSLESVTLPAGLTSIGQQAFYNCTSLESVTLPAGLTTIGQSAFYNCTSLESVTLPAGLTTIGQSAFSNCTGLTHVTFNCNIPNYALQTASSNSPFYGCNNIDSCTISDGVVSIGSQAFYGCTWITGALILPNTVTTISDSAFYGCTGLTSVEFSSSVNSIGNSSFRNCTGLTSVTFNCYVPAQAFYNDSNNSNGAFRGCPNINSVTICQGCSSIGGNAFYGYTGDIIMKDSPTGTITLPNTIVTIGNYAFYNCSGLTGGLIISSGCTTIGVGAFYNCTGLTSINIPAATTDIQTTSSYKGTPFAWCTGIGSVSIDSQNTRYTDGGGNCIIDKTNNRLIFGCKNTVIPNTVTTISEYAFSYCSGLTSINIPASVTWLSGYSFENCSGLTSITVDSGNTTYSDMGNNCIISGSGSTRTIMLGCKNTNLSLLGYCTTIGTCAFSGAGLTGTLNIPSSITSIGGYAFRDCTGLTEINFPINLETIQTGAFQDCTGLTGTLTFPNTTRTIDSAAFRNCTSLTGLAIPAGYNNNISIESSAFWGCNGLTSITVDPACNTYSDGGGCNCLIRLYSNGQNSLYHGCRNTTFNTSVTVTSIGSYAFDNCGFSGVLNIPASIRSIGQYCFRDCTGITSVVFNSDVSSGSSDPAFLNCTGITSVVFNGDVPNYILSPGWGTPFRNCPNINSVTINEGCTRIGYESFYQNSWLTSITIPSTVTTIGNEAFYKCDNLTTMTCLPTTPPSISEKTLPDPGGIQHIYVPAASESAYEGASYWNIYATWIYPIQNP